MQRVWTNVFKNTLNEADVLPAADVVCVAGVFQEVGRYTLSAGEALEPGYDVLVGLESAPGRIFIDAQDNAAADYDGDVRLMLYDERDFPLATVWQARTEDLRLGAAARAARTPFPSTGKTIGPDQSLVLMFRPDAPATFSAGTTNNTLCLIDVTSKSFRGR